MKRILILGALLIAPAAQAWNCKYEKDVEATLDLSGSDRVTVLAAAGELEIQGGGGDQAVIRGRLCVSEEEWLDEAEILTAGGREAEITVDLPDIDGGWYRYASMDLEVRVPAGIDVVVRDSSGDMELSGLASADVKDSSGDIEIRDIAGPVTLEDSSGDIEMVDVRGDVTVARDSSGDIEGDRITGSVLIERDSSGSIRFTGVSEDFTVERDSSGDITGRDIGGNFTVLRDGSGEIRAVNVTGTVSTPENS